MSRDERRTGGTLIAGRLLGSPWWQGAARVVAYVAMDDEPSLERVLDDTLRAGKVLLLPRVDWSNRQMVLARVENLSADLVDARHGMREPGPACAVAEPNTLGPTDLVIVPGVAFDPDHKTRLGRGAGMYDRWLSGYAVGDGGASTARPRLVGVAFDEQLEHQLPAEAHDARMDMILTPTRWLV